MTTPNVPSGAGATHAHNEAVKEKKDLASWWKNFKRSDKKNQDQVVAQGIFGVPLQISIRYANVAISLFNDEGQSYIYGYVPIVVAKCGVFLKEKATDVEGIFRLAGSEKRIKELKIAFDSPDRYGKGLDWTGYTVHDAANILRRYFNQLPEPIIPLEFYQKFRDPLRNHQAQAVGAIEAQSPSHGKFEPEAAIRAYQALITELPPLHRQLLLYILDLLAVFASKSDLNKMTTPNLAAIFQPGILRHPQHDMVPQEYRLSQDVLIFLIENQDSFLIGMQGTAVDPETVREVQSGTPPKAPSTPTTPNRSKTVIARSASNSSVAAESVRKWGSIRRNVSVSSKHSKRSENAAASTAGSPSSSITASGVHRSNTVPSRRGGSNAQSARFSKDKHSDPSTPNPPSSSGGAPAGVLGPSPTIIKTAIPKASASEQPNSVQNTPTMSATPAFPAPPTVTSTSPSQNSTLVGNVGSEVSPPAANQNETPEKDVVAVPLLAPGTGSDRGASRSFSNTTSTSSGHKGFLDILKTSPTSEGEKRKPNKLQKKRIPGSTLSSAQSSNHSLNDHESPEHQRSPVTPNLAQALATLSAEPFSDHAAQGDQAKHVATQITPTAQPASPRPLTDNTLRPTVSPSNSFRSHTDVSDADMVGDDTPSQTDDPEKKKRHRWRFSRPPNKIEQPSTPGNPFGTLNAKEQTMSRSTIGSGGSAPRRSFQEATPIASVTAEPVPGAPVQTQTMYSSNSDAVFSDSERERKGPMSWIRNKIQERKDKDADKRSKTPDRGHERARSKQDLTIPNHDVVPIRNKSFEQKRGREEPVSSASSMPAEGITSPSLAGPANPSPMVTGTNVTTTVQANGAAVRIHDAPKTEVQVEPKTVGAE